MCLYVSVRKIEAFEHFSNNQYSAAELGQQQILGQYSLRFYTEECGFDLKSGKYLAQTEIVRMLSRTQ
jgi:hypothetical protein